MTDTSQQTENLEPFKLKLFSVLEQAQKGHGVTHQDYSQYWSYCTAKLSRLRHVKPVRTILVHNPKYESGSGGGNKRRNGFVKRNETNPQSIPHVNILWNLFFQAERAWAQACALQQQQQQQGAGINLSNQQPKNQHGHVQRRLNKAVKFATALVELVSQDDMKICDEQSGMECKAYLAWMKGNAELEHKNYASAYRYYKESLVLLVDVTDLARNTESNSNEQVLTLQDIWINRAETVIRPLLRYCQYEAKGELSRDDLLVPSTLGNVSDMDDSEEGGIILSFRGKDVSLEKDASYKDLAVLYLKMESFLKHPESLVHDTSKDGETKDVESKFLQLLSDLDDAIAVAQTEYNRYDSLPSGPSVASKKEELQAILGYFRYHKLNVWRYQQEARISQLEEDDNDPEVMVHAYDALLQNGNALSNLLTSENSNNEDLEDDALWLEVQAHLVRIRAVRCFHLVRLYESSPSLGATPKQIQSLLKHCRLLTERAKEEIAAIDDEHDDENENIHISNYLSQLEQLIKEIEVLKCRVDATMYLAKIGAGTGARQTSRPLWLRADEWDSGDGVLSIADDPPLPIPMSCKGTFFDIAWQHIGGDFPLDEIEKLAIENNPKKQKGILGWLTGGR